MGVRGQGGPVRWSGCAGNLLQRCAGGEVQALDRPIRLHCGPVGQGLGCGAPIADEAQKGLPHGAGDLLERLFIQAPQHRRCRKGLAVAEYKRQFDAMRGAQRFTTGRVVKAVDVGPTSGFGRLARPQQGRRFNTFWVMASYGPRAKNAVDSSRVVPIITSTRVAACASAAWSPAGVGRKAPSATGTNGGATSPALAWFSMKNLAAAPCAAINCPGSKADCSHKGSSERA